MILALTLSLLTLPAGPPLSASPAPAATCTAGNSGKVFLTIDEALLLAFPDCEVKKETLYLTKQEAERAGKLAKVPVETRVVHAYVAEKNGVFVGTAYFDSHKVRTLKETLMISVGPDRKIRRLEILAFAEPEDYLPRGKWYGQFLGRKLDDELSLKRGIRGVTGATVTARVTTDAARRVLALHEVVLARASTAK